MPQPREALVVEDRHKSVGLVEVLMTVLQHVVEALRHVLRLSKAEISMSFDGDFHPPIRCRGLRRQRIAGPLRKRLKLFQR